MGVIRTTCRALRAVIHEAMRLYGSPRAPDILDPLVQQFVLDPESVEGMDSAQIHHIMDMLGSEDNRLLVALSQAEGWTEEETCAALGLESGSLGWE